MEKSVWGDFSTATDLADYLAVTGIPFRRAHEMVGQIVRGCLDRGIVLEDLDEAKLAEIDSEVPASALSVLKPSQSIERRESLGAPGPRAMEAQLAHATRIHDSAGFPKIA